MLLKFIFPEMEENSKHILMPFSPFPNITHVSHSLLRLMHLIFPSYEIDGLTQNGSRSFDIISTIC